MIQTSDKVGEDFVQAQTFLDASVPVGCDRELLSFQVNSRAREEDMNFSKNAVVAERAM